VTIDDSKKFNKYSILLNTLFGAILLGGQIRFKIIGHNRKEWYILFFAWILLHTPIM
jgi:long-subunit acyl-CoA synthetase (AMP-forming)